MSKINCNRSGCRDVFKSFLVRKAHFDGKLEMPVIEPEQIVPTKIISFSEALRSNEYDAWIHFYEDDASFERLWNNPKRYLPVLKRFAGIITPDFSLYRDMPLVMQEWNTYRGRAIGAWAQAEGIHVICNVRVGDDRSFEFCCLGVPKYNTIAVGSHGCIKVKEDRQWFSMGLANIIHKVHPATIIVYGTKPDELFKQYEDAGIMVICFKSECARSHLKEAV